MYEIAETQDYDSLPLDSGFIEKTVTWLSQHGTKWAESMGGRKVIHSSYNGQDLYGLVDKDAIIALGVFVDAGQFYELRLITNITGTGGNFYPMLSLLFTIKEYIGKPIIDYGSQSKQGQRFLKALSKNGHFNIFWYNTKTGEKNTYNPDEDVQGTKPYRSTKRTDWRILVEHTEKGEEEFPREGLTPFGTPQDFFTTEYTTWIEIYEDK